MLEADDLPQSWRQPLSAALAAPSTAKLRSYLADRRQAGATIFPPQGQWFRALELTPLEQVKAVILAQDPYHGAGQAHGLAFSVQPGVPLRPSLKIIYRELQSDVGIAPASHGFLEHWARQGVLLLNTVLTVEHGVPDSHKDQGWEHFTDVIIQLVAGRPRPSAFLLWGDKAKKKAQFVDGSRHLTLTANHPAPPGGYKGFLGCRHFSRTNAWLAAQGLPPIDWALPPV